MKLRVARKFDKVMLDRENPSDFIKFIYEDLERQLYERLMDKLKDFDSVAYVRFASVYREFKDVNTFMAELKKLLDK